MWLLVIALHSKLDPKAVGLQYQLVVNSLLAVIVVLAAELIIAKRKASSGRVVRDMGIRHFVGCKHL